MIVASHQPNFMPYMGFFYKMYMCDIFTLSDTVQFSKQGFHNYNFIRTDMERSKLTVPVSDKNGPICMVRLSEWEHNRKKLIKRLRNDYARAPYFDTLFPYFERMLEEDYLFMYELNERLIRFVKTLLGIECVMLRESDLGVIGEGTATQQIVDICKRTGCDTYLSGTGAKVYLDESELTQNGISLLWSAYEPDMSNLSVFHYLMHNGPQIPVGWFEQKEALRRGRI